ncbi:MAG: hypothetical protein DRH30_09870 [Deltaproteobacteria bacterium]|nr:MAG: hypothetical protein DRH30_09870 [Deltaproteobacteria bacterium]
MRVPLIGWMGATGATLRIDALWSPEVGQPRIEEFIASSDRLGVEVERIAGFAGFSLVMTEEVVGIPRW